MINDGNAFPAPPGLIAGMKVGANDGTNDNIGVNHSEMGNNLKVRNAIEKVLNLGLSKDKLSDYEKYKNTFWIKRK